MKKLNFCLLGLGHVAQYIYHAIKESNRADLVCACDIDKGCRDQVAAWGIDYYESIDTMLSNHSDLDAAVIATPTPLHFSHAGQLLQHMHVFIEKPATESLSQFHELLDGAGEGNLIYSLYHAAFSPALLRYRHWIEDKSLGPITGFYATYIDGHSGPETQSSLVGPWQDSGPNALSVLLSVIDGLEIIRLDNIESNSDHIAGTSALCRFETGHGIITTRWVKWHRNNSKRIVFQHGDTDKTVILDQSGCSLVCYSASEHSAQSELRTWDPLDYESVSDPGKRLAREYGETIQDGIRHILAETDNRSFSECVLKQLWKLPLT